MYSFDGFVFGLMISLSFVGFALTIGSDEDEIKYSGGIGVYCLAGALLLSLGVFCPFETIFEKLYGSDVRSYFPCMKNVGTKIKFVAAGLGVLFVLFLIVCNIFLKEVADARALKTEKRHTIPIVLTGLGFVVTKGLFHFQLMWNTFHAWRCSPDMIDVNWAANYFSYLILFVGTLRWWRFLPRRKVV